jgi:hypothetical protein
MTILTYIGIGLLCMGYVALIIVSLSSKPGLDEKNKRSMPRNRPVAVNQPQNHPSARPKTGTPG